MKLVHSLFALTIVLSAIFAAATTQAQVPAATTQAATSIGITNTTFNATINPSNSTTTYYFAYGTDTNTYAGAAIPNPSFEANTFTNFPGYVSVNTAITGWTVSNPSHVGLNPSGGNPFANTGTVPAGTNVAFI